MAAISNVTFPDTPAHLAAAYWAAKIEKAREQGIQSVPGVEWWTAEIEHWKQRAEELEVELECMRNAFPEHDNDVSPKIRGIY
ncbi:MAG: hypothetical protein JRE23_03310 [Deltaproteobacteria bacterium]|nr:hypothetical protein [Deltaproteobacteria bacterium]